MNKQKFQELMKKYGPEPVSWDPEPGFTMRESRAHAQGYDFADVLPLLQLEKLDRIIELLESKV